MHVAAILTCIFHMFVPIDFPLRIFYPRKSVEIFLIGSAQLIGLHWCCIHVTPKCNVGYCGTIKLPLRYSHDYTAPLGDGNTVFHTPHLNRLLLTFQYNESSGATSPCMQLTVCTPSPIMLTSFLQYYFTKLA